MAPLIAQTLELAPASSTRPHKASHEALKSFSKKLSAFADVSMRQTDGSLLLIATRGDDPDHASVIPQNP
jgi:hypothetical protein